MRKTVLLLVSTVTVLILASGMVLAQEAAATPETTLAEAPEPFGNTVSPSFSFTSSEANSTFECKMDDGAFQLCPSPKQYLLLSEGEHTFQVRAKDASGSVDPTPAQHTWTIDSFGPKVTFTERPGEHTNDRTLSWAWTVEDANPGSSYDYCALYDWGANARQIFSTSNCASPLTLGADIPDGFYQFRIIARDKAYNTTEVFDYVTVDTVAPAPPKISSPANNSYDLDGSITLRGTTEPYATVRLFEGATLKGKATANSYGQWSKTLTGVSVGSHTYTAKAIDRAGNISTVSNARTVTVDTAKPNVVGTGPQAGAMGVLPGANVTAFFSEAMRAGSINTNTVKLFKAGETTAIEATVTYEAANKKAILNPNTNLSRGVKYKAVVTTKAMDIAGNPLDQNTTKTGNQPKVWFFTVRN